MADRLSLEGFEACSADFDCSVDASDVDRFCSRSEWILPFHQAFLPERELFLYRGGRDGASFVALASREHAKVGPYLEALENMWCFACPLIGPDAATLLDAAITDLANTLRSDVNDQIGANLPETIIIDELFLEAAAGTEVVIQLRELRRLTREGFVFTDEDLVREMTSPGSGTTVEDIELMRDVLSADYTITERDLLDRIGPAIRSEEEFETSRRYFGLFRGL